VREVATERILCVAAMNAPSRHFAAAWALIGVLVTVQAGAQAPVTPGAAPAAPSWGVFDKLAGQELKSNDGGYTIRFSWVRPGEELLQEWVHPSSGKVVGTAVTVRDPVTGQLREGKTVAASAKGYLGTTGSDGSVAFLKGKSGYRWQLAADGFVERVDLKLAGSTVVAKPAVPYARWALPVAPPATLAAGAPANRGPIILVAGRSDSSGTAESTGTPTSAPVTASARPAGTSAPTPQVLSGPSRVTELPLGITAPGKLAADAEVDAEGRPYRCYSFTAAAGTSIKATVSSKEFQPLVRLARGSLCGSARVSREVESQRGAAELSEQIAAGGNYVLLVGSRTPGATGRFQLALEGTEAPMAAAETPEVAAAAGAARVASTGGGSRAAAPSSRAAAMQAQTAVDQAELDRRAAYLRDPKSRVDFLFSISPRHVLLDRYICVHGSPTRPVNEYLFPTDAEQNAHRIERSFRMLTLPSASGTPQPVSALVGHTHVPGFFLEDREFSDGAPASTSGGRGRSDVTIEWVGLPPDATEWTPTDSDMPRGMRFILNPGFRRAAARP